MRIDTCFFCATAQCLDKPESFWHRVGKTFLQKVWLSEISKLFFDRFAQQWEHSIWYSTNLCLYIKIPNFLSQEKQHDANGFSPSLARAMGKGAPLVNSEGYRKLRQRADIVDKGMGNLQTSKMKDKRFFANKQETHEGTHCFHSAMIVNH